MAKHHTSTNSDRHFYQRPDKICYFWRDNPLYSEESRIYFETCAQNFILSEANAKKTNWIKR